MMVPSFLFKQQLLSIKNIFPFVSLLNKQKALSLLTDKNKKQSMNVTDRILIIKTRDELLRIKSGQILFFEADRNYTKLFLNNGIKFTFAINIGKIEKLLTSQLEGCHSDLVRVGKSHIINKNCILQINLPKQRLILLMMDGKPQELTISKDPLKILKESIENEMNKKTTNQS